MVVRGAVKTLAAFAVAEIVVHAIGLPVPAPLLGMALMLGWFALRGGLDRDVAALFDAAAPHLTVLFVPAGAGIVVAGSLLAEGALALLIAVTLGTLATTVVAAVLARWALPAEAPRPRPTASPAPASAPALAPATRP